MTTPTLTRVRQHLAAVAADAERAIRATGQRIQRAGHAVLAAAGELSGEPTLDAAKAALAALDGAKGDLDELAGRKGSPWQPMARVAIGAWGDLSAIIAAWPQPKPPAEAVVTVAGDVGDVPAAASGPTTVRVPLRRTGDPGAMALAASCGWTFEGLASGPIADNAAFRPGDPASEAAVTVPGPVTAPTPFVCRLGPPLIGLTLGEAVEASGRLVPAGTPGPAGGSWLAAHGYGEDSGHGWLNGITPYAGKGVADLLGQIATFRNGVPITSMTMFQGGSQRSTWDEYLRCYQPGGEFQIGRDAPLLAKAGRRAILTIPLLHQGVAGQWAAAAAGQFAAYWRQVAEAVKGYGLPAPLIVRFDRESDDKGQPFGAERDGSPGFRDFKAAHDLACRTFAEVLGRDGLIFTFCLTKRGARGLGPSGWEWSPEWIDAYDCDFYVAKKETFADPGQWTLYKRFLEPFIARCEATGKPICFSEWGVSVAENAVNDNEFFMQSFFPWLQANKVDVLHENYYNPGGHAIYPDENGKVLAPKASAAYRALWGGR